jgi:hypothetical protein
MSIVAALAVLMFAGVGIAAAGAPAETPRLNPYVASYPFQSAIVHYEFRTSVGHGPGGAATGMRKDADRGTQVIWIKGDRLAKSTRLHGAETLEIYTPDHVYTIDLTHKKGTRIDNPKKPGRLAWAQLSDDEKVAFHARLRSRGVTAFELPYLGTRIGSDTVLKQRCDLYHLDPPQGVAMTTCLWAGSIPLRVSRRSFLRNDELIATRIEQNVRIAESRFAVPVDVTITHDEARSDIERRHALARFDLFKTGTPMVVRIPVGERPSRDAGMEGEAR